MTFEAVATVVVCTVWLLVFAWLLAGLRNQEMPKPQDRPSKGEGIPVLRFIFTLGATIMSALESALARLNTFVRDVVTQLGVARDTNATQTEKLTELQAKLEVALSDDDADKAAIVALQNEVSSLQDAVAAQINAAIDSLENVPAAEDVVADSPVEEAPVEDEVSDELVVVEDEAPIEDKPAE